MSEENFLKIVRQFSPTTPIQNNTTNPFPFCRSHNQIKLTFYFFLYPFFHFLHQKTGRSWLRWRRQIRTHISFNHRQLCSRIRPNHWRRLPQSCRDRRTSGKTGYPRHSRPRRIQQHAWHVVPIGRGLSVNLLDHQSFHFWRVGRSLQRNLNGKRSDTGRRSTGRFSR